MAREKTLESGHFFIIIETLIYGSMTVGQSSVFTSDYKKAKIAAANIFSLVDRKSDKIEGHHVPRECRGDLNFSKVGFEYPQRRETQVLRGLSFSVNAGQTVALVGASGCGKSTSVQLLEKFYDVIQGVIVSYFVNYIIIELIVIVLDFRRRRHSLSFNSMVKTTIISCESRANSILIDNRSEHRLWVSRSHFC